MPLVCMIGYGKGEDVIADLARENSKERTILLGIGVACVDRRHNDRVKCK